MNKRFRQEAEMFVAIHGVSLFILLAWIGLFW